MKKLFSMLLLLCGFLTLSATLVGVNAADLISYKLVTDVSELTVDSTIIITDKDSKYALGSTQNTNNRVAVKITVSADGSIPVTDSVQDITLEAGNAADTLAFNVGNGYLYAASSGSNHLKTEQTLSANSSWKITIDATTHEAEIKAQGNYTRNLLRKNSSSALFSCYASGQTAVKIYKKYVESAGADEIATYKFYLNDGTDQILKEETVAKGTEILFPSDPKREGYIFNGWFDAAEGGNKVESLTINDNTDLYAHWEVDPYTHAVINLENFLDKSGGKSSSYADFNGSHNINGLIFNSNQVSNYNNHIQFQSNKGYLSNTVAISGHIASITMEIESGEFTVSTSTSALTENAANVVTLNSTNKQLVVENPEDAYFLIKVGSSTGLCTSIDIAYTYVEKTTYAVAFSAGAGAFATGKGGDVIGNIGETTTVTLPTQADLSKTAYNYSVLSGWMSGATVYAPGQSVEVSTDTSFVAQYASPENITVAQALEIADLTGTTASSIKFITTAEVKSVSGRNLVLGDASTSETIVAYASSSSKIASFRVGDIVKVEGKIKIYDSIKRFDSPSYTLVTPIASTYFQAEQTKASLKIVNDVVSIRFGNAISADSFVEGATYGVVASTNAADLENLTFDSVEALKTAGKGFVCTPVRVNAEGVEDANGEFYQFALVLTGVPASDYNVEVTAVIYMTYNNTLYTAAVKTASVKSVAAAYLAGDTSNFSADTIAVLQELAQ